MPWSIAAGLILVVAWQLQLRADAAATERGRWTPGPTVWVTTEAVVAGETVDRARPTTPPAGFVPAGAVTEDPNGRRARVDLVSGEILVAGRLAPAGSANAARTPDGWVTIALDRTSDLFEAGDRVDLLDLLDGRRLATAGFVVVVTDNDVAVAVPSDAAGTVVQGLGRGGVVAVLRSG